jgi:hypothetical protein
MTTIDRLHQEIAFGVAGKLSVSKPRGAGAASLGGAATPRRAPRARGCALVHGGRA